MASVDDRIVRMEFDNASFERKIDSTITSLGHLEKALKFDSAKQGFSDISASADKLHFGGMSAAIEGVSAKFIALSTIAITALSHITTQAISTGVQLAKSLSLDQIISGFKEYELNMQSIQTILSNTKADGTNLQQVNAALDELNKYADQTIYNFGQMTKNIGTFTAAGVDLDTSVQSIKGISNLAAISGSSAEQASSAMYQLSQAVSTGTLRLQDWNSVVNAGMGGEVFQKALFETGKTLGTIKDVPIDKTFEEWTAAGNTFRGSLEEEWLTAEVLTTTLQGFTGEMTEAQLLAIGYTKEQAAQIMELGQTGVEAATKVRTLTQLIATTKESIGSGWSESFRIV
ncbi:MAG: tape measure protein, partial [Paenisporosarcina sp.]